MGSLFQAALAAFLAIPIAAGATKLPEVLEFLGTETENATIASGSDLPQVGFMAGKESNLNRRFSPRGRDLFARQVCTYQQSGSTLYCNDPSYPICCQWTDSGTCCPGDTVCAASKIDLPCRFSVSWTTIWETSTEVSTEYSTEVSSVVSTTVWTTEYSTTVEVVTRSDISTATQFETVYITVSDARKRALPTVAPSTPVAAPGPRITSPPAPSEQQAQKLVLEEAQPEHPVVHAPLKRAVRTETSTTTDTTTYFITSTAYITSLAYYAVTSTATSEVTSTSTSALNAKTTVTETTTSTYTAGRSPPPASQGPSSTVSGGGGVQETQINTPNNNDNKGSGLSKGAQIGIGAGTGAGSLIICIILAFWLHRRRKNKKAEMNEMISAAVAAANANNANNPQSPPPNDNKMPVYGVTQSPPPPTSSPYQGHPDQRFSDPIPVYNSAPHSPTPVYRYPSPGSEGWQGHEMSATPVMGHQQPYYGGQPQMGQAPGPWTQNELPTQRY